MKRAIVLPRHAPAKRQRGAAFLVLALMVGIAATALIISAGTTANDKTRAAEKTAKALATAREALVAFAVSVPDTARPGDLPCPATDYTTGIAAGPCDSMTSRLGYLPWKTLGLPDLRDGSGAPLLYAVSNGFKNSNRTGTLNSDTPGEYSVNGENAIAIVFAPGPPIGTQDRIATTFNRANFLELSNADVNTTFENSAESGTINDRLIWITPRAFFPTIEMRAMRVAQNQLQHYFSVTGRYPRSNRYMSDTTCWTTGGRLPYELPIASGGPNPCLPGGNGATAGYWTQAWPAWFFAHYWDYVIHYAVADACTTNPGTPCDGVTGTYLRLNGIDGTKVLMIRQGIPNGQSRPCTAPSQCLDDTENRDSDRDYVTPVAGNDKLTVIAP
jgi:type II secretory pathway pseudopilin PulG